jgi:hypothetical protein
LGLVLVAVLLAGAGHVDWHLARSTHHGGLSGGWPAHWILAVPTFALVAWYVHRAWPQRILAASLSMIGLAAFLAQGLEPLGELALGATLSWTFGAERLGAFARYMSAGIITYVIVLFS